MKRILRKLYWFAKNPYVNLAVGVVLLGTAGYEIWLEFENMRPGAHHGVAAYSIIYILKTLPNIIWGLENLEKGHSSIEGDPDEF